jgi:hypothetical protein
VTEKAFEAGEMVINMAESQTAARPLLGPYGAKIASSHTPLALPAGVTQ